jgi:hypothetical protein
MEGENPNTATIVETGQTADAVVTVDCGALEVTKTAETSFTRTYTWTIEKSVDPGSFLEGTFDETTNTAEVQADQTLEVDYDIVIDATYEDTDHHVEGVISVENLATIAGMVNEPTDLITPGDIAGTVSNCAIGATPVAAFPVSLPAGETLTCDYEADLPNADTRTNTATATVVGGTEDYDGSASIDFSTATINEVDECVDVTDLMDGVDIDAQVVGTWCYGDGVPKTFTVTRTFGPEDIALVDCEENIFHNTATATANDTDTEVSDDETITLVVPCPEGCTLTQGYWKTHNQSFADSHNGHGPAPDDTWCEVDFDGDGLFECENEMFFDSGMTWFQVFNTAPKGNVYYNLAHQYMAAVLNVQGGASDDAIATELAQAETLFETYTPDDVKAWKGNQGERALFISLAGTLGSYNEGEIGPGHCTEDETSLQQ